MNILNIPTIKLVIIFFSFCFISFKQGVTQNSFIYQPLECRGEIPFSIRNLASNKYKEDKKKFNTNSSNNVDATRFYLKSNFLIDDLLISGYLYYGDQITEYIYRIADSLLSSNQELKSQVEFYTSKSTVLNAFSTDKGIIVFNLGLIARAKNEAQIAFVLAHELSHFIKKHNLDRFIKIENTFKENPNSLVENGKVFLELSLYSQAKEFEADSLGFTEFYKKSQYSKSISNSFFDLLKMAYLPYEDKEFAPGFFNINNYRFDTCSFVEKKVFKFPHDTQKDSLTIKTHPGINERAAALNRIMGNTEGGKLFLQPQATFENVQKLARYEMSRQYYINGSYCEAIVNSLYLLEKDPNSEFLLTNISASLYAITKYQILKKKNYYSDYNEYSWKNYTKMFYVFNHLTSEELCYFTMNYINKVRKRFPNNKFLNIAFNDLLTTALEKSVIATTSTFGKTQISINGYDQMVADTTLFRNVQHLNDSINKQKVYIASLTKSELKKIKKQERKNARFEKKYGSSLGIDSISIINPLYFKINEQQKDKFEYEKSESKTQKLFTTIEKYASSMNLNVNLLAPKIMKSNETNRFNDYSLSMDWLRERFAMGYEFNLVPYNTQFLGNIKTDHIAMMGSMNILKNKNKKAIITLLIGYITAPIGIYLLVTPDYYSYYYYFVFDTRNGDLKYLKLKQEKTDDKRGDFLHAIVYDSLNQTKRKSAK